MAKGAKYVVQYRRKREKKTDYKKRLNLLKSGLTRLAIRPSNKYIQLQLIEYKPEGDNILSQASSKELTTMGWSHNTANIPSAYLTGLLLAKKADGKIKGDIILDDGLFISKKGSRIYAATKGAVDGGLKVKIGGEIFPEEARLTGEHISSYVEKSKTIVDDFKKIKNKINPSQGSQNDGKEE